MTRTTAAGGAGGALAVLSLHSLVYLAGSLLAKLSAILLLPILTDRLSREQMAVLELTDATLGVLLQLVGFQLDAAVTRHYLDARPGRERDRVVSTAFLSVGLLCLAALVALALPARATAGWLLDDPDLANAMRLVGVILVGMVLTEIPVAVLRAERRSVAATGWLLLRLIAELGAKIALLVGAGLGVMGVLLGQALAATVFLAGFSIWLARRFGLAFDGAALKSMVAFSAPMVAAGLCQFALHSADRFLLRVFVPLGELGLYGVGYRFGYAVSGVVLGAFLLIWYPFVFGLAGDAERRSVVGAAAVHVPAFMVLASLPLALFAPEVVAWFTAEEFHRAWIYVPPVLFAYLFWSAYQVLQTPFYIVKRTAALPALVAIAAAANVAINCALLPRVGAMGAAFATAAAFALLAALGRRKAEAVFPVPVAWRRLALPLAVCGIAAAGLAAAPIGTGASLAWRSAALVAGAGLLVGPYLAPTERAALVGLGRAALRRGQTP